jgi:hypothetical protein
MMQKGYLCAVVTQDAWQTPTTNMDMVRSEEGVQKRIAFRESIGRKSIPDGNLGEQMQRVVKDAANWPTATATNRVRNEETLAKCAAFRKRNANQNTVPLYLEEVVLREEQHGQAAPANPSTDGSRQGLWPTPDTQTGPHGARGVSTNPNHQSAKSLEATARTWATPQAHDAQGPKTPEQIEAMRAKGHGVKNLNEMVKQWPTPASCTGNGGAHGLDGGSGARSMLPEDMKKSSGKLNPRWVETLMGLPIGWTMPSCTSPQTIAPTNCASSATESCQPLQNELFEF